MSILYHLGKVNVVADALSPLSISCLSYVEDEVKAKKDHDPILIEWKEVVLKKPIDAFSQGRDGVLHYQVRMKGFAVECQRTIPQGQPKKAAQNSRLTKGDPHPVVRGRGSGSQKQAAGHHPRLTSTAHGSTHSPWAWSDG
ncbi:hypothetical protein MTR67_043436 [Solanum verrucosum]|uniref:Uncharacterized protein n=1 Tax=Solanum verrucosum TaxID=315347 RepID=A0AAF0URZ9_SOLVR|nr:hypothetical protein MTR67_043436 [Solanum verrucosum]